MIVGDHRRLPGGTGSRQVCMFRGRLHPQRGEGLHLSGIVKGMEAGGWGVSRPLQEDHVWELTTVEVGTR